MYKVNMDHNKLVVLMLLFLYCQVPGTEGSGVTVAAFNIQILGVSKMGKPHVVEVLVKILRRYDIILIQEIRDSSGTAIVSLLDQVNANSTSQYNMTISGRLGRSSSKEQYAYMYRLNAGLELLDTFQHPDSGDVYEREPYSVLFRLENTDIRDIVLIGLHSKPTDAVAELDNLTVAHNEAKTRWNTDNILILGDLNADCSYVTQSEMSKLLLRASKYHWWIEDSADTTVSNSDCSYDRFIMTGSHFISSIVNNSVQVYRFDTDYGMTQSDASEVSDHYPIELTIQTKTAVTSTESLTSKMAMTSDVMTTAAETTTQGQNSAKASSMDGNLSLQCTLVLALYILQYINSK